MSDRTWKKASGSETTSYPKEIWKPAAGKKVRVWDIFMALNNKSGGEVNIKIRFKLGTMETFHRIGCGDKEKTHWSHSFVAPLETDAAADPADVQIEVDEENVTSTDYRWLCSVQGEEV